MPSKGIVSIKCLALSHRQEMELSMLFENLSSSKSYQLFLLEFAEFKGRFYSAGKDKLNSNGYHTVLLIYPV